MAEPKILIFHRTDKILTSVKASHFLISALKIRYKVEEIERKEEHCSHDPLDHKTRKHPVLEVIVSRYSLNQRLEIVGFCHLDTDIVDDKRGSIKKLY
jgi:hypothetical protein